MYPANFDRRKSIRRAPGVYAGPKKRLIDIDVAQAGDDSLIQQERLQDAGTTMQSRLKHLDRKAVIEGFRTHGVPRRQTLCPRGVHDADAAELARIIEAKLITVIESQHRAHMRFQGRLDGT
jgi:hypothetical protein